MYNQCKQEATTSISITTMPIKRIKQGSTFYARFTSLYMVNGSYPK